jgi:hypothetical protein
VGALEEVDRLLHEASETALGELSVEELRARREGLQSAEVVLSYVRRRLQAEIDLAAAELDRRAARAGGRAQEPSVLVDDLPGILAGRAGGAAPAPRLPLVTLPGVAAGIEEAAEVELDELLGGVAPSANLHVLDDDELRAALEDLRRIESEVSAKRRALHEGIDSCQAELVVRYKSGRADPAGALGGRGGRA